VQPILQWTLDLRFVRVHSCSVLHGGKRGADLFPTATYPGTSSFGQGASAGLSGLVQDTISRCDPSQHRDLLSSICLTGGASVTAGVFERLYAELNMRLGRPPKLIAAAGGPERRYCSWTGGSILATFSEFQKLWFSKEEYDENGASFVHKKCV